MTGLGRRKLRSGGMSQWVVGSETGALTLEAWPDGTPGGLSVHVSQRPEGKGFRRHDGCPVFPGGCWLDGPDDSAGKFVAAGSLGSEERLWALMEACYVRLMNDVKLVVP